MRFYLDTSVIVAALTSEDASPRVRDWLRKKEQAQFYISEWVKTEVSAALSIKVRTNFLNEDSQAAALAAFGSLTRDSLTILPIPIAAFAVAARFADQSRLALRSGDALHLAIVEPSRMPLATLDKQLAGAGPALGVATLLL